MKVMKARQRKPEKSEVNAARQAQLRERRKAEGFKRLSVWLSPEQIATLETLGGEPWLGSTVKALLSSSIAQRRAQANGQRALFAVPGSNPLPDNDKAAQWREADSLHSAGLSWGEIARRWNDEGRRTDNGAEFRGGNISREVRKWQGGNGE